MLQRLPIGIQTFSEIREGNWLYVDKTEAIYRMTQEGKYYFFSRPRRFGKSLTLSTLKSLFQGREDLFKGLWIEDKWDWTQQHPVVHISFSSIGYQTLGLEEALKIQLDDQAKCYEIELESEQYDQKFKELLVALSKREKVVLLIDEYDKPIIDYLTEIPQAKANQKVLKTFYSVIKDSDPYIRLLMITGVSKFSKVSIFSELNNLEDISLGWRFANLVGITQEELEANFGERIEAAQKHIGLEKEALLAKVKDWYNGYSWDGRTFVYNPFSLLSFFQNYEFQNFWFATGTPTFLIKLLRERQIIDLEGIISDSSMVESYDIERLETTPLLFQTGYITIKEVEDFNIYTLDYPNREVKESLWRYLIASLRNDEKTNSKPIVLQLRKAFLANNIEEIIKIINALFKSIPYQIFIKDKEAYYHSIVFLVFKYLGQYIEAEVNTSDGRIDAMVATDSHIYLLEFKLDESAAAAIAQIRQKNYAAKYQAQDKKILALGINFSSATKSVEAWELVEV
ncbi:MAG: AAA family ATPase [Bacteroidota bacterium]